MHTQLAGEFQIVVKDSTGVIKTDTGFIRNLILDTGLDWFGNTQLKDSDKFHRTCLLGTGKSMPDVDQTKLDNAVLVSTYVQPTNAHGRYDFTYNPETDGNIYKVCTSFDYVYTCDNNYVLTEIGLSSNFNTLSDYTALTRALILDKDGKLNPITVNPGSIINVRYRLWSTFILNPIQQTIRGMRVNQRPLSVGTIVFGGFTGDKLQFYVRAGSGYFASSADDLLTVLNMRNDQSVLLKDMAIVKPYVSGSHSLEFEYSAISTTYSGGIDALEISCSNGGRWGYTFPYNGTDYYLTKDAGNKLAVRFKYSWGRYDGELR